VDAGTLVAKAKILPAKATPITLVNNRSTSATQSVLSSPAISAISPRTRAPAKDASPIMGDRDKFAPRFVHEECDGQCARLVDDEERITLSQEEKDGEDVFMKESSSPAFQLTPSPHVP
jgi:hypothetical protein